MSTETTVPNAGDLMNRNVRCVSQEMPLADLVDFLLREEVSCAPVVDSSELRKLLIGFVSESDALEHMSNEMFYGSPRPPQTVATCMKRHPISVTPDIDAFALCSLLVSHGYRHLPVVDDTSHLLGLVSRREVLTALKAWYFDVNREHDREHFPPDLRKIMNHRFIVSR
jgi:CBS domain-containing protein